MKCPHCSETFIMTERQGVEINYCRKCRGVWLHREELNKIIERVSARTEDNFQRQREDSSGNLHYRNKKRNGFLENLFDFD